MKIWVDTSKRILRIGEQEYPCAIGKHGVVPQADGREGDGKTPLGTYPIRYGLYRADRVTLPQTKLAFWRIHREDGWCDTPSDPAYNRPVSLPYPADNPANPTCTASAEALWRDSHVYDVILVLGHNDSPPVPNMGSAVFLHVARENYAPTLGCVAVSIEDILALLALLDKNSVIDITA